MLPTLLQGKQVDHYMDFDDETKTDLAKLKAALEKVTGRTEDPLAAVREFVSQLLRDFNRNIKKDIKQPSLYPLFVS